LAIKYLDAKRIRGTAVERAALSTAASNAWEMNPSGEQNITIGSDRVNYDITTDGDLDATLVYDLGTSNISETSWVLRGKSVITNYDSTSASSCHFFCGLSNGGKTVAFDGSQNSISFAIGVGTDDSAYYIGSGYNQAMYTGTNYNTGNVTHEPTEETLYFEIIRSTATAGTINLFTDSSFTTSPSGYARTVSFSTAPTGLRYLVFKSRDRSISGQECQGYIDNLQFYNGMTSPSGTPTYETTDFTTVAAVYPNLPNGAIFEESDGTGKHYMWDGTDTWNEIT